MVGVAFLGVTIAFAKVTGTIKFYSTPSFAKKTGYVSKYESDGGGAPGDDGGESENGAVAEEEVTSGLSIEYFPTMEPPLPFIQMIFLLLL